MENIFFWKAFLEFYIALCRSKFLPDIIFLLPEKLPLLFLIMQFCWKWILSAFVCLKSLNFTFIFKGFDSWRFYGGGPCFFQYFERLLHSLTFCIALDRMSAVILIFIYMYMSFLPSFKFFSYVLVLAIWLWYALMWPISSVHWDSWTYEFIVFTRFGKCSVIKSSNVFSDLCPPSLHLGYNYTYVRSPNIITDVPFFSCFFLYI